MLKLSQLNMNYIDNHLTGRQFEFYLADLMTIGLTYTSKVTPATNDHGIDIIYNTNNSEPKNSRIGVQAKLTHGNSIGYSAEEEAIAGKQYYHLDSVVVMTNGFFSSKAQKTAKKLNIDLWDRNSLESYTKKLSISILSNSGLHGVKSIKLHRDSLLHIELLAKILGFKSYQSLIDQMISEYESKHFNTDKKISDFEKIYSLAVKQLRLEKRLRS